MRATLFTDNLPKPTKFKIPDEFLAPPDDDAIWESSPFYHLRNRHSVSKGSIFEKIVRYYLQTEDKMKIIPGPKNGEYDFIANDEKYELKGAFLNTSDNSYWFNQIRDEYDYKWLVLAGFDPDGRVTLYRFTRKQEKTLKIFGLSHGQKDKKTGQKGFSGDKEKLQQHYWKSFLHG